MQQYMVLYTVDPDGTGTWGGEHWDALNSWLDETIDAKVNMAGNPLRSGADATTVKIRGGQVVVTDGPFAETKEQISGYDLLACESLDEAVSWAAKHPASWLGSAEVRALVGDPLDLPPGPVPEPAEGKTRYMLFVCDDPAVTPEEAAEMGPVDPWVADTDGRAVRLFGSELAQPAAARTVRVRDKQAIVSDGPFAETKEQIAGFDVLDCADLDEAIEVAARHPMARGGLLELRPFRPLRED
jgi:hypothetical protein